MRRFSPGEITLLFHKIPTATPQNEGMGWHVGNDTCQRLLTAISPESSFGSANPEIISNLPIVLIVNKLYDNVNASVQDIVTYHQSWVSKIHHHFQRIKR